MMTEWIDDVGGVKILVVIIVLSFVGAVIKTHFEIKRLGMKTMPTAALFVNLSY